MNANVPWPRMIDASAARSLRACSRSWFRCSQPATEMRARGSTGSLRVEDTRRQRKTGQENEELRNGISTAHLRLLERR